MLVYYILPMKLLYLKNLRLVEIPFYYFKLEVIDL